MPGDSAQKSAIDWAFCPLNDNTSSPRHDATRDSVQAELQRRASDFVDAIDSLQASVRMVPSADVLVVNDHPLDAQTALFAFEQVAPRARVLHLFDGSEALQYLFSTGTFAGRAPGMPQLVILSLEMKTVSGLCVLDLMRAHPLTCDIPVVLTSLERNPRVYRRNNKFDANAYITLPCDFDRYCAVIEGCTEHWLPWARRPSEGGSARLLLACRAARWRRLQPRPEIASTARFPPYRRDHSGPLLAE
jgi:two-component system response regulator